MWKIPQSALPMLKDYWELEKATVIPVKQVSQKCSHDIAVCFLGHWSRAWPRELGPPVWLEAMEKWLASSTSALGYTPKTAKNKPAFPFSQPDLKSKTFLWWGTLSWNATGLAQAWGMDNHSVEAMGRGWSSERGDYRKLSTYHDWQVRESDHGWSVNVNLMVVTFPKHLLSARCSIYMISFSPSTCR